MPAKQEARRPRKRRFVLSVGYEGRGVAELIALLRAWGVLRLLDVRELPLSRRVEYRKGPLSRSLASAGIEYLHVADAGNPFRKMKADTEACLRAYRGHLRRRPAVVGLVNETLGDAAVAMLCYEREHERCHRSVLLEALEQSGAELEVVTV